MNKPLTWEEGTLLDKYLFNPGAGKRIKITAKREWNSRQIGIL